MHRTLRTGAWAAIVAALLALAVSPRAARGQAVTPGTTPTPVASATPVPLPGGEQLLEQEQAAVYAKDTYHAETQTADRRIGRSDTVTHGASDVAWREQRFHDVITTRTTNLTARPPSSTSQRIEDVLIGTRVAFRFGHGGWLCASAHVTTISVPVVRPPTAPQPTTVGTSTVDGVAVWEVDTPFESTNGSKVTRGVYHDFISQLDYTLVHETISSTVESHGKVIERRNTVSDYTRYGVRPHIRLPAACRRPGKG